MAAVPSQKENVTIRHGDQDLNVVLSEHHRARRLSLRVDPIKGCVVLTKPRRASKKAALAFAQEKAAWIADRLGELVTPIPFRDSGTVPIRGTLHTIRHQPNAKRGVWLGPEVLNVSGSSEHLSRRVHDWFKQEARKVISPLAHSYAHRLEKKVTAVSMRDTRSRWGSCTADGKLSFSWRLLMTPEDVMHYVIAHEVAHLCEMNHSARFWKTVESLIEDRRGPTAWLKTRGGELHRYGLEPWTQEV